MISKLQYITQGESASAIFTEAQEYVDAGGEWLQLRIKSDELDFMSIAKQVQLICRNKAVFIINDKVNVAAEIQADGVHLGLTDMPIAEARKILGEKAIIGGTANTAQNCLDHIANGADYIGLGPFRHTTTKKDLSPVLGLKGYYDILSNNEVNIPVVAIGGIIMEDVSDLVGLGNGKLLHGIAVSGLIKNAVQKKELIEELKKRLDEKV